MKTPTRVYLVRDRSTDERYLVRATTPAAAIKHVAAQSLAASVATQDELISAVQDQIPVETAGEEAPLFQS